jgi:hypothetical protein
MHSVFGYLLGLVAVLPAFSSGTFFWLLGRTTRQHDWLAIYRATVQMMANVASPVKLALTMAVLLLAFASDSPRPTRGMGLLAASIAGLVIILQIAFVARSAGIGVPLITLPSTAATLVGFSWGFRLLGCQAAACNG